MAKNSFVSVIMPVYNGLDFLEQSIKSILNQKYSNLELIIIDDGSDKETKKYLNNLPKLDNRIRVFHEKNSGQSVARNLGLSRANGEYIYFMDSDDIADPELVGKCVNYLDLGFDTVIFDIGEIDSENKKRLMPDSPEYRDGDELSVKNALNLIIKYHRFVGPTNYMSKKSIYTENNIKFHEGIIFEDQISTPLIYSNSQKIVFCGGKPLFWYRRRGSSSTGQKWKLDIDKTISDLLFALSEEKNIYLKYFDKEYIYKWHFLRMIRFYNFYFPRRIRKKISIQMKNDLFKIDKSNISRRQKMIYLSSGSSLFNFLYRNFRAIKDRFVR
ncbi:glycosyltransferase family 2 protein [Oenococcus alcoholitolerans]|uniref:glycosyltransferase family 2 protein n=1 Tax=Oenococcus alcoholitolerans TaxID=931074 RepID=UPI003F7224C4